MSLQVTLLRPEDNSEQVVELQKLLNEKNGCNLPLTGIYGPLTTEEVKKFQSANGLEVDGIAGPNTIKVLINASDYVLQPPVFYILAGHDKKSDPGAVNASMGLKEANLAVELRDLIVTKLKENGLSVVIDDDKLNLADTINSVWNKVKPNDILLDIHFNAASPEAGGTEAFVSDPNTKTEDSIASELVKVISKTLGIVIRPNWINTLSPGVKYETSTRHKRLGILRPACQNVLIEICFISNPNEMKTYLQLKETLAIEMANVLTTFTKV